MIPPNIGAECVRGLKGAGMIIPPGIGANCVLYGLVHATAFIGSMSTHRVWRVVCTRQQVYTHSLVYTDQDVNCFHCILRGYALEAYER